jgi:hypothetical protein
MHIITVTLKHISPTVSIDMIGFLQGQLKKSLKMLWNDNLFKVDEKSIELLYSEMELFHTVVLQGLFLCKHARPDISLAIATLTTRVQHPAREDWMKLVKMMRYLKLMKDMLTLRAYELSTIKWYTDASFALHPDFRSHTGAVMTMGQGAITSISRKQGMNTQSLTEAEVVAANEVVSSMIWTKLFLEEQGYPVKENVLYPDNRSAMLLEEKGQQSAGKRSRHLNIRLFFVKVQKEKGNLSIQYCPTDKMIGDFMTKPLHSKKFEKIQQLIMNLPCTTQLLMAACFED